jgi:hypothetical protein
MPLIASIDGPNRDIYLDASTVNTSINPIDIYKEMRTLRRNSEELRKYKLFLSASGNVPKGGGKFTERLVTCLEGTRIIPFDSSHTLTITGTIITDDGQEGIACFDRSLLTVTTIVDINYIPPQVEVIEVATGSALTVAQDATLTLIRQLLENGYRVDPATGKAYIRNDANTADLLEALLKTTGGAAWNDAANPILDRGPFTTI